MCGKHKELSSRIPIKQFPEDSKKFELSRKLVEQVGQGNQLTITDINSYKWMMAES